MSKIVINICNTLYQIRMSFGGYAIVEHHLHIDIRDFSKLRTPTISDDRKNLRNDFSKVGGDLKKAIEEKTISI